MSHLWAGRSLIGFGLTFLAAALVGAAERGAVAPVVVLALLPVLGVAVHRGNRTAVQVAIGTVSALAVACAALAVSVAGHRGMALLAATPVPLGGGRLCAVGLLVVFALWGAWIVARLAVSLRGLPVPLGPDGLPQRFQFSLRTLLLWMVPLALIFGAAGYAQQRRREERAELDRLGAGVEDIEARYAPQIDRLRTLAVASGSPASALAPGNPLNVRLFAPPEILEAAIAAPGGASEVVARKPRYAPADMRTVVGGRLPRPGRPTSAVCECTMADGSTLSVVRYTAAVLADADGHRWELSLVLDRGLIAGDAPPQ